MEPFIKHSGVVAPLDRVNVDTDQMVPKQFLKFLTREGYGRVLFYDWRYLPGEKLNPDFVLNQPRYKALPFCWRARISGADQVASTLRGPF